MNPRILLPLITLSLAGVSASAQTVGTFSVSNGGLNSINVNGDLYAIGDMVHSSVTGAIDDDGNAQMMIVSTPPTPNSLVLSGTNMISGLVNVKSVTITFDAPVMNIDGLDILIFDWGAFGAGDDFTLTINGITSPLLDPDGTLPSGYDRILGLSSQKQSGTIYTNASTYNSVAELNSIVFASSGASTGVDSGGIGLDLSNFGVTPGGSITELTIFDVDSTMDPTLVLGLSTIPEPQTYLMALGVLAGVLIMRRRR